ncbi:MAG: hypothetical protein ABJG78_12775 [Cyclobacteriaceae bacterium]
MKSIFGLLLVMLLFNSFSQAKKNELEDAAMRNFADAPAFGELFTMINRDLEVDGTTYYIEKLKPGKIKIFKNDHYLENITLRYNVYSEKLEVKLDDSHFFAKNRNISEFIIEDGKKTHRFFNSRPYSGDLLPLGFIRSIYLGEEISLFAKDRKVETKYKSQEAYSSAKNIVRYLDDTQYYIHDKPNSTFILVKSKHKLLEDFPALTKFRNFSKSKLRDEKFLVELAGFIDK